MPAAPMMRRLVWLARAVLCVGLLILGPISGARAQIEFTETSQSPITIRAASGTNFTQGAYQVWLLDGNCQIEQGAMRASAQQAVVWIEPGDTAGVTPHKLIVYLEGDATLERVPSTANASATATSRLVDRKWIGRLYSATEPALRIERVVAAPAKLPSLYQRAASEREAELAATQRVAAPPSVSRIPAVAPTPKALPAVAAADRATGVAQPVQFNSPGENGIDIGPSDPFVRPGEADPFSGVAPPNQLEEVPPEGARRIRVFPRSDVRVQAQWFPNENVPGERIAIVSSGVNLIVDGLDGFGSINVATDRLVIWTRGEQAPDLSGGSLQDQNVPFEIYLEGNIVFRQGDRVIFADRMFYDVRGQRGTVLNAEILTPVPNFQGLARLRAEVLQQVNGDQFIAQGASLTTSRMGIPTYDFRAGELIFQDMQQPAIDPTTGMPRINPATGEPVVDHRRRLTSRDNTINLGETPVFYWPSFSTDLEQPSFYFERVLFKQDSVFGTQFYTDLNMFQLLGVENPPEGVDWNISLDYLSERGPAGGTTFLWNRNDFFGLQGPAYGIMDAWGIYDSGRDNLGRDFRSLEVPDKQRGRVFTRHRQYFNDGYQLTGEIGYISDRNFLEQYFENEWDEFKDQTTGLEFKRYIDNQSWALSVDGRINPFFTQTQQLPRLDHYLMGQSLLGDALTWSAHSSAMYANFQTANPPTDPVQLSQWGRLPWESEIGTGDPVNAKGGRFATRHEIDMPLDVGGLKVVPYALGEAAYWGEDLTGSDLTRLYGMAGVRASAPFWAVSPEVEDDLLNLHGLAHKVVFDVDAGYASADQDFTLLPLYDQIDDDNIEAFRRRFPFFDFGGPPPVPFQFDERFWAIRSGMGGNVSSPSTEVADDMFTIRTGVRQRWQTKRGPEFNRRIVDWITLDAEATIFPDAERDNFGETLGLANYNFIWHVGDRLSLVSDGYFDFYSDAPKYVTVGGYLSRPPRGSLYLGFRSMEGPISANVIAAAYSYRMSPKWASTFGTTFNIGNGGNIGQNLSITRIGESFLVTLGVNVDASKGNVGANFAIEPRFLARALGGTASQAGLQIAPAGAYGLE